MSGQVEADVVVAGGGYLNITTVKGIVCTIADVPAAIETDLKCITGIECKVIVGNEDIFFITGCQSIVGIRTPLGKGSADFPFLRKQGFQADFLGLPIESNVENTGFGYFVIIFGIHITIVKQYFKGIVGAQQEIFGCDQNIFRITFCHDKVLVPVAVFQGATNSPFFHSGFLSFAGPNQLDLVGCGIKTDTIFTGDGYRIVATGISFVPAVIFADFKFISHSHIKDVCADQHVFFAAGDHFKIFIPVFTIDCSGDSPSVGSC